ncbi:hypothetical protein ES692_06185 [Psychroserpens burtonensis]|uniref:Uncharacterized protein n=1 Tax=Psychroserpens burtonensis TaxID=49278 RepID=A0A5C7B8J6_9FLAO|nr:hypothetical protein [Psychroserpens burtonensis]TXE18630.1 hypothetical protein ES692_06185 [Psychroserpens burtonensis]
MHSIQIIGTSKTLEFPETAIEFSRDQLLSFSALVFLYQIKAIEYQDLKVKIVYSFLNMVRTADLSKNVNNLISENVNAISKLVDNYFTVERIEGKKVKKIDMLFYTQILPEIKINAKTFYGPTSALFNTLYGEYLQLLNYFTAFSQSGNEQDLDNMVATIYRPKKADYEAAKQSPDYDGDIRIKFNPNQTDDFAKDISKLPFPVKYAVFLFVASSQHFIATNNALDIGGGNTIDLTLLFEVSQTKEANSLGMIGTLYSLAETKVFGTAKDVANQNTYDVLAFLVNQKTQFNNLKSQQSNAKT